MKKLFLLTILTAFAMHTMAQQVKYSVKGTYADNGKKIYLVDKLTDRNIDSAVVVKGKFSFKGKAEKNAFMGIEAANKKWTTIFFNDGKPIVVNVNDSTLKGSLLNERLTKYDLEGEAPNKKFSEKVSTMTQEEIMAHEKELMDELNNVMDGQIAHANKIFKEESHTLIPLAFAELYFYDNGLEAYDDLVKEQVVFANHPYLKKARDEIAKAMQQEDNEKTAFVGQPFTDLEMADPDGKMHKLSETVGEGKWVLVDFWAS